MLKTTTDELDPDTPKLKFDISDEISELERDMDFVHFIQSDDIKNVEHFVDVCL